VLLTMETSVGFPLSPVGRVILTIGQSTLAHLGMTSCAAKGEACGNSKGFGTSARHPRVSRDFRGGTLLRSARFGAHVSLCNSYRISIL
jgi:hypothetical protein